jgi:hypothetical protein
MTPSITALAPDLGSTIVRALRAGAERSPTHLAAAGTLPDRTASWAQR